MATVQTAQRELTRNDSQMSGITGILKINDGTAATNAELASSSHRRHPSMKKLMTRKQAHQMRIKDIVVDQTRLKRTYGEDIQQFFESGPIDNVINIDVAKFNKIYG